MDRSGNDQALLGMEGFVVLATTEEDGELFISVETVKRPTGCATCGVRAVGHGRSVLQIRDLPAGGRPVRLVWRKRRFLCREPDCPTKSFTESSPAVEGSITHRAAVEICRRVGRDAHSVASVARDLGIGWSSAMAAVRRHGTPLIEDERRLAGTRALGVDEHKMLGASRHHRTMYATSFVDLRSGRLLDVVPGRSADDVAYWLFGARPAWRSSVRMVAIDPHRGYANGLLAQLPHALVTIDCFHAIRLGNAMVDDVRRRTQNDTLHRRGRKADPLYRTRRLMTRGFERLALHQRQRLIDALWVGDPNSEVCAAILGKELLRHVFAARDLDDARGRLQQFYRHAAWADVRELSRLARTVRAWELEILNYHVTGISNGPTEAQNLVTEKVRRIGHGFRSFSNYRLRLLLHSGVQWDTHITARIRGRQTQLVA